MRSVFVTCAALLVMSCDQAPKATAQKPPIGRFVIVQSREQAGDYLLDTATGKTWASYRLADHGDLLYWSPITRVDDKTQEIEFLRQVGVQGLPATGQISN